MKTNIFLPILITLLFSCNSQEEANPPINTNTQIDSNEVSIVDKERIKFNCNSDENVKPVSHLIPLASKLSELENNYQIKSTEQGSVSSSIILWGLKNLKDLRLNKKNVEIVHFEDFERSISAINFCQLKGTKDLGGQVFARAKIEELIFSSTSCAIEAFEIMEKMEATVPIWEDINKSPSSVLRIDNRIYYISSGGWFMMDFYGEIERKLKE